MKTKTKLVRCYYKSIFPLFILFASTSNLYPQVVYHVVENYTCTVYKSYYLPNYSYTQYVMTRLALLRADVNTAVANDDPYAAINFLSEIITLNASDFYAWEFLSYSYAVVGDSNSAANADIDIVARFDNQYDARAVVNGAINRLSIWDPYGWRTRVNNRKIELGITF